MKTGKGARNTKGKTTISGALYQLKNRINRESTINTNMATALTIQGATGGGESTDLMALTLTPEQLQLAIANESALRAVITNYVRDQLKEGHHYYYLTETSKANGEKPGIAKEGAINICSLFKVVPVPDDPIINFEADGHMTVRARVNIINRAGVVAARGEGMASTKESKYASQKRWLAANKLPAGIDKDELPVEQRTNSKNGSKFNVYLLETTSNPADHYNTVLKMAEKRAIVGAVTHLPLVSELFTANLEPGDEDATRNYVAAQSRPARAEKNVTPKPKNGNGRTPAEKLTALITEIRGYGIADAEIQAYLKNLTGAEKRADLNEAQIERCIEAFEPWANELHAKLTEKGGA